METENNIHYYAYYNQINANTKTKLIEKFIAKDLSVHVSQISDQLHSKQELDEILYADAEYYREEQEKNINKIHEKEYGNNPSTESKISSNEKKSSLSIRK